MKTLAWAALALGLAAAAPASAAPAPMPVIEVALHPAADTLVVLYSGDGGWAPIDKAVSAGLAQKGFSVVGVDALRYLSTPRTPAGAASDLAAVIDRYDGQPGARRIVLAGYSLGADALPLLMPELPHAVRARIALVALISPDPTGRLDFRPSDWLNLPTKDDIPLGPSLARMHDLNVLCIYGEDERTSGCPAFKGLVDKTLSLPGGHHYGGHAYGKVVDAIAGALEAPAGPRA